MSARLPAMLEGRAKALGDAGRRWLEELPRLAEALSARWGVRLGAPMEGGSHAFVAPAEGPKGERYALKIELPDRDEAAFLYGAEALTLADGRGMGRLIAHDAPSRALLLERLGERLINMNLSPERQMELLCGALAEVWAVPGAEKANLPGGAESVAWFRDFIPSAWRALGRPCGEGIVRRALDLLEDRAARLPGGEAFLLHGDAHNNNLLRTLDGRGFKLIDPDGLVYERAYDLGVLMREWPEEYRAAPRSAFRARAARLEALTGVPARDIRVWGYLQTVSTALVLLQIGQAALGKEMLRLAGEWTPAGREDGV